MPRFCGTDHIARAQLTRLPHQWSPTRHGAYLNMELRKDPITRSWVIIGDDVPDNAPRTETFCRFCADAPQPAQVVSSILGVQGVPWSARAVVHPTPLYHIEGEAARRGEGLYDRMRPVGAH